MVYDPQSCRARRKCSAPWKPVLSIDVKSGVAGCDVVSDHPRRPPGLTISYHVWVPPMSRRPSYYWHFLPVAVRLITLYFCQSSVTSMINVEFYVTQADKSSKGLMFTSFGRTLTNEMTHVMSKISRELLDFVSLEQGKYQNTRETCCWVESHAGDVLLLFPVPF